MFHDVTHYLEKRYGLHGLGAVTLSPERPPGARRLSELREKIKDAKAICVFAEPQFPPKLVDTLVEGTQAKQRTFSTKLARLFPRVPANISPSCEWMPNTSPPA